MAETLYVIRRASAEPTNPGDVYVTGPHEFGLAAEIYSSTRKATDASRYTAEEANDLLACGKWKDLNPRVVPVEDAVDLEAPGA